MFQKRIYSILLGTLVGKRKQTIFKKRWFDIINEEGATRELETIWKKVREGRKRKNKTG